MARSSHSRPNRSRQIDDTIFEVRLRSGLTFHDGSPVTAAAISRAVTYLVESGSDAASLFAGITGVEEGDDGLTARIICGQPSPWLPAQFAPWLVLLPDGYTHDQALANPVGSGPYRVESIEEGNAIALARNPDYTWGSPKGKPHRRARHLPVRAGIVHPALPISFRIQPDRHRSADRPVCRDRGGRGIGGRSSDRGLGLRSDRHAMRPHSIASKCGRR